MDTAEAKTTKAMEAIRGVKKNKEDPVSEKLQITVIENISISPASSFIPEVENISSSPSKTPNDTTNSFPDMVSKSLSDQIEDIYNSSNLTDEPHPMIKYIKNIMETYQTAIENLTTETVNMREELNDQKQQILNKIKVVKQQQNKQNIEFQNKLHNQQQNQQKQNQQLKQQIMGQSQLQQAQNPPPNCIQYEPITNPYTKVHAQKTSSPKTTSAKPSMSRSTTTKESEKHARNRYDTSSKYVNAAAGPSKALLKPTLFPPPKELQQKERKPRKIDAMILGSSIVKHVPGRKIKQKSGIYAKVCSFPGADTEKVCDHAEVELKYSAPQTVILHAGGNDLAYGTSADEAVDNLAYLGLELKDRGVQNIAISAMTPRYLMRTDIDNINKLLEGMCRTYNFDFIKHNNILYNSHICQDGVHLNFDGVDILTKNFTNYLKNLTPLGYKE